MIKTASGPMLWMMNCFKFLGWTSLWGDIYIKPGWEGEVALIKHEQMHLEQMRRDGKIVFMVKYCYWLGRYGYTNNPYEREARESAGR